MCSESPASLCIPCRTSFDISIKANEIVLARVRDYCAEKSQRRRGEFEINMSHCRTYVTACGGILMISICRTDKAVASREEGGDDTVDP